MIGVHMTNQPTDQWLQRELRLAPKPRGFHLITREVVEAVPELAEVGLGLLHVYLQHTSASLTINENADPDVRRDLEKILSATAPENFPYRHTAEGPEDMPGHFKASLMGVSLTVPVTRGQLALGIWQGIYLCEHRSDASGRTLVLTVHGQRATLSER